MIRSLLVAYDGSHGARVALQHAVDIASRGQGRVILVTVGQTDAEVDDLSPGGVDLVGMCDDPDVDATAEVSGESDEVIHEALDLCRDLVVRCVTRPAYGDVAGALVRGSRLSDLLVLGRDARTTVDAGEAAARTARRVAAGAESPVMVTPREYNPIRSVVVVCPASAAGGRALCTAAEMASILQVKLDALVIDDGREAVRTWQRDVRRYLIDHALTPSITLRKPPTGPQISSVIGARQSPLVVVPRGSAWEALRRQDMLSVALESLGATVIVQP